MSGQALTPRAAHWDHVSRSDWAEVLASSDVMKLPREAFLGLAQDPEIALKTLRTLGSQNRRQEA
jgi:hypothetical protein